MSTLLKTSIVSLLFVFVSFTNHAQLKYEVSVLTSTFDHDRIQLQQRFQLVDYTSMVVTLGYGFFNEASTDFYQISDSIGKSTENREHLDFFTLKVGAQQSFQIASHRLFYVGGSFGVGVEQRYRRGKSETVDLRSYNEDPGMMYGALNYEVIESSEYNQYGKSIYVRADITFGADIPLTKRLSLNAAVNFTAFTPQFQYYSGEFGFKASASGGLRYSIL